MSKYEGLNDCGVGHDRIYFEGSICHMCLLRQEKDEVEDKLKETSEKLNKITKVINGEKEEEKETKKEKPLLTLSQIKELSKLHPIKAYLELVRGLNLYGKLKIANHVLIKISKFIDYTTYVSDIHELIIKINDFLEKNDGISWEAYKKQLHKSRYYLNEKWSVLLPPIIYESSYDAYIYPQIHPFFNPVREVIRSPRKLYHFCKDILPFALKVAEEDYTGTK